MVPTSDRNHSSYGRHGDDSRLSDVREEADDEVAHVPIKQRRTMMSALTSQSLLASKTIHKEVTNCNSFLHSDDDEEESRTPTSISSTVKQFRFNEQPQLQSPVSKQSPTSKQVLRKTKLFRRQMSCDTINLRKIQQQQQTRNSTPTHNNGIMRRDGTQTPTYYMRSISAKSSRTSLTGSDMSWVILIIHTILIQ